VLARGTEDYEALGTSPDAAATVVREWNNTRIRNPDERKSKARRRRWKGGWAHAAEQPPGAWIRAERGRWELFCECPGRAAETFVDVRTTGDKERGPETGGMMRRGRDKQQSDNG